MTVTVKKPAAPIAVPVSLQRKAGFKEGDKLEFTVKRGVVTLAPSAKVRKRKTAEPNNELLDALAEIRKQVRAAGMPRMTIKQINDDIAEYRAEKRAQRREG